MDRDYPTEFYEEIAQPGGKWFERSEHMFSPDQKRHGYKLLSKHVKMERTYLNAWQTFMDRTKNVPDVISKMLDGPVTTEDLYSALRALNVCRFQAKGIRDQIGQHFIKTIKKIKKGVVQE